MKSLTKAEEQIMLILWLKKNAFVKEIIEDFPEPKPAYNTVSTIIRILEKKGFVVHESFGKSHRYKAAVTEDSYKSSSLKELMSKYFGGNVKSVLSHFVESSDITAEELRDFAEQLKSKNDDV